MKKRIFLSLLAVVLSVLFLASCTGKEEQSLKTSDVTTTTTGADEVKNPHAPTNTENWADEEWDNWVNEGADEEQWNDDVFVATDDVWEEEEWGNDDWTDVAKTSIDKEPEMSLLNLDSGTRRKARLVAEKLTEDGAKTAFSKLNPDAEILSVRTQGSGKVIAIYGLKDNIKYKTLFNNEDGALLLNKVIEIKNSEAKDEKPKKDTEEKKDLLVDEAKAREVFAEKYPDASLIKVQLQDDGDSYYMYGTDESKGTYHKMKIRCSDGRIVYDYCGNNGYHNYGAEHHSSGGDINTAPIEGGIDEAKAKKIFLEKYPDATILKIQLQDGGKSYFIFGQKGNERYKMKILVSDGSIVMDSANGSGHGEYHNYRHDNKSNNNNSKNNNKKNNETTKATEPKKTDPPAKNSSSVDEAGARAIFSSYYPDVSISKCELQGETYYMYGISDNMKYIMKVRTSNGDIIVNKSVSMGGGKNHNNNGHHGR